MKFKFGFFSWTIRGEKADNAVLCSDCETLEIKEVECSNTMFVARDLRIPSKKEANARTDSPDMSVATVSFRDFMLELSRFEHERFCPLLYQVFLYHLSYCSYS